MSNNLRMVLTIVISVCIVLLWSHFFPQKQAQNAPAAKIDNVAEEQADSTTKTPQRPTETQLENAQMNFPIQEVKVENEFYSVVVSTDGGVPVKWFLKKYNKETKGEDKIEMANIEGGNPLFTAVDLGSEIALPERPRFKLVSSSEDTTVLSWRGNGIELIKRYTFRSDNYLLDLEIEVVNHNPKSLSIRPAITLAGISDPKKSGGGLLGILKQPPITNKAPLYYLQRKVKREGNVYKLPKDTELPGSISWAGMEDRYFMSAVIPRTISDNMQLTLNTTPLGGKDSAILITSALGGEGTNISAGERKNFLFTVYAGPKDIERLKAVGVGLEEAIDYGWFSIVAMPILYLLKFFYNASKSWGLSIILLTVFIRLVLNPISKKSMKSMKAMQRLQPQIKELQQKFKNDKQRINQETMKLFQAHKVNPMGGCLPMLLQFPIYIALYRVLWNSIELFHVPFLYYPDLSGPDPYFITPVILGVFMFLQQKLMPSASADPVQQKMMMFMPIMFTAIMLFLPAGLVLYILISTVMGVVQQVMYNKGIRLRDLFTSKCLAKIRG